MTAEELAVSGAIALAAAIQAISGAGFGLLAAPLLLGLAPSLVPGPLLLVTPVLMALTLWQDRRGLHRPDMVIPSAAGGLGALAAVPVLPLIDGAWLPPLVGAGVVAVAGAALLGLRIPGSPTSLVLAGVTGGALATIAAMPGPPVIVVYRTPDPVRTRANLALFFLVTCVCSIVVLTCSGELGRSDLDQSVLLLPGVLGGLLLGAAARPWLPLSWLRPMTLWLVVGAGLLLLVRSAIGR